MQDAWFKAYIRSIDIENELQNKHGKVKHGTKYDLEYKSCVIGLNIACNVLRISATSSTSLGDFYEEFHLHDVEKYLEVEDDFESKDAMVSGVFKDLSCDTFAMVQRSENIEHTVMEEESTSKEIGLLSEEAYASNEAEAYVDSIGNLSASSALHRTRRALIGVYREKNKRRSTQTVIVDYFTL